MNLAQKKQQKKKEEIILSAVKIMNRNGSKKTTMEQIAAELLMTKGSLYYYFKNKEDLIYQCHEMVLSRAIEDIAAIHREDCSSEERLKKMIHKHIDYAIYEKETFNMIVRPDQTFASKQLKPIVDKRSIYSSYFDLVIQEGIEAKEFEAIDYRMVRMMILGAMNWIQQWYKANGSKSVEEIQEIYSTYLLKLVKS